MATSTPRAGFVRPEITDTDDWHDIYTPFLDDVDAAVGAEVFAASSVPASGFSGKLVHESDTHALKVHDGSAWVYATPPVAATASAIGGTHVGQLGVQTSDATIKYYTGSAWADPTPAASTSLATYLTASTQACANNSDVMVVFDGSTEATSSLITKTTAASGSGGGSVFTFGQTATYMVVAQCVWVSNNNGRRELHIIDSTNTSNRWGSGTQDCSNTPEAVAAATCIRRFTAGDAIRIMVNQNSGGSLDIESKAWGTRPRISIARLGG